MSANHTTQPPEATKCLRCLVSGRVQGVYYRASTQQKAQALGLCGYAVNLPDGRVEVLAMGAAAAVDELVSWLRQGPSMANVTRVDCEALSAFSGDVSGFKIG